MKKTQWIELKETIGGTKVSYAAILMFVMLAVAIYTGIGWSGTAFEHSMDEEFDRYALRDFELLFPYGLEQSDIETLLAAEGVTEAEGSYTACQFFDWEGDGRQAKLVSVTRTVDVLSQMEGRWPEAAGEVVLEKHWAVQNGVAVGDSITFRHDADGKGHFLSTLLGGGPLEELEAKDDPDGMQYLTRDTVTVVGLAESPAYISRFPVTYGVAAATSTPIDCLMFASEATFDEAAFAGYPSVLVRAAALRGLHTREEDYKQTADAELLRLRGTADQLAKQKNERIRNAADSLVAEAEQKLEDARAQLAEAEAERDKGLQELQDAAAQIAQGGEALADARAKLRKAEAKLRQGEADYAAGEEKLRQGRERLAQAEQDYAAGEQKLAAGEAELEAKRALLPPAREKLKEAETQIAAAEEELRHLGWLMLPAQRKQKEKELADAKAALEAGRAELAAGEAELAAGEALLETGRAELAAKKTELEAGRAEVTDGARQLEQAAAQLAALRREIANARALLADKTGELERAENELEEGQEALEGAEAELETGRETLDENAAKLEEQRAALTELKEYGCTILTRESNGGSAMAGVAAELYEKLRLNMALLFLIVGLLVCYSAVSRIVHGQTILIGTKKALGFTHWEVTRLYLLYVGSASAVGAGLGLLISRYAIEPLLLGIMKQNYLIESTVYCFAPGEAAAVTLLEMGLTLAAAWIACRSILKRNTVQLLRWSDASEGGPSLLTRLPAWQRMSLFTQTIVNNCLQDGRRVFAMVVGVAGCTSLVVCAFSFYYAVFASFERQYTRIQSYDTVVYYDAAQPDCAGQIEALLRSHGLESAQVYRTIGGLKTPEGEVVNGTLLAVSEQSFDRMLNLYDPAGKLCTLGGAVWLHRAYAEEHDLHAGDALGWTDVSGQEYTLTVGGVYEYYLQNMQIIMSAETYAAYFGEMPAANSFLVERGTADFAAVETELRQIGGYIFSSDYYAQSREPFEALRSLCNAVVGVYLALSGVMSLMILLNLLVMFVEEKKRELITLMINGFSLEDARRYIYSDTILLTAVGITAGIAVGLVIARATIDSMSSNASWFLREISVTACLAGAAASAGFTLLVSLIALRRIAHFRLSELTEL